MSTIERKPLPPLNSQVATIMEAHRAEIVAHAKSVIEYYLNGPGSYFDGGTQKPLVSEFGESAIADLENFKAKVIASKQFAGDPNSIMDSVVELIDKTMGQVQDAANHYEGEDGIWKRPPSTDDPIDDPRVISPRLLNGAALPISLYADGEEPVPSSRASAISEVPGKPVRILSRRIAEKSPASAPYTRAPATSDREDSFDDRFGDSTSSPTGITSRNPNLPMPPAEPGRPLGIFTGKQMPLRTTPPSTWGSPDSSEASGTGTKPVRYVSRRDDNTPPASVFDTGAPAAQFVLPEQLNTVGGRTDWAAALAGLGPLNPMQAAAPALAGETPGISSTNPVRILSRRIADRPQASVFDAGAPPVSFVSANEVFSPARRNAFGRGNDASSRIGGAGDSPSTSGAQGSSPSALLEYIQYLNQRDANKPQASMGDSDARGASLAPSDSPTPMGGLAGRIAALAGIDPDNPDRPVPLPGGLLALLFAAQQR